MSRKIAVEIIGDASSVNRSFASASRSAKVFDRDLGKTTRGVAAGSGVFRSLGRSLAFASGGFLAVSGITAAITDSIKGAESLAKAQKGLAVAVEHTGGNLGKLIPKYTAVAKGAADFGENQADATTALERATVLTGNAAKAQRAYQEALDISKATGKDFNAVLTATSKGQEGITTSLQRYGIQIAKGTKGTEQFVIVQSRFAGQAKANTDAADRFRAILANTEETIGTGLLPTVDKYLTELGDWLEKMEKSGRLQHDVNTVLHDSSSVFHTVGDAIHGVDKVTGSFLHTLELLAAFKLASLVTGWVGSLRGLSGAWAGVTTQANLATAAEGRATGLAGAGGLAALAGGAGAGAAGVTAAKTTGAAAAARAAGLGLGAGALIGVSLAGSSPDQIAPPQTVFVTKQNGQVWAKTTFQGKTYWKQVFSLPGPPVITPGLRNLGHGGSLSPSFLPSFPGTTAGSRGGGGVSTGGPFGTARPVAPFKSFALTLPEQLAQARATLTKSTADDVAAAKQVIARIKKLMDEGKLSGKSLLQALQAESAAMSTLQSAQAAAAQKAAAAAQKAKAAEQARFQHLLDPLKVEVQLSRAEAFGKSTIPALRALLASAKRALASAKSLAEEKAALDQITQLNQALKSAQTTAVASFTIPAKLQLALAKDAALGKDSTKDLLKLRASILKFIRTHHKNIAALTDAYNQLAQVNQELGSSPSSLLGLFKQASTKALTAGLGLNAAQRKALRQRLAGLGPGGTVSGSGVGAAGFVIDPTTGRPIKNPAGRGARGGSGGGGRPSVVNAKIDLDLNVNIDGHHVEATVTKRQQKRKRRNPSQRRGPNAGG